MVPLFWLLMLAWSKPWLDRFRYGPFEWAWRSLARLAIAADAQALSHARSTRAACASD